MIYVLLAISLLLVGLFMPVFAEANPCTACNDLPAGSWQVDVSGITNAACTSCSAYNISYVFTAPFTNLAGACVKTISIPTDCNSAFPQGQLNFDGPGNAIRFRLEVISSANVINWTKTISPPIDCRALSAESLPYDAGGSSTSGCNGTSSTALLTAI